MDEELKNTLNEIKIEELKRFLDKKIVINDYVKIVEVYEFLK